MFFIKQLTFICMLTATAALIACEGRISSPRAATVQGCVSEANGGYVLTTDDGHKYLLTGNSDLMKQQVGREALVRGEQVTSSRETQAPPQADGQQLNQLDVVTIKQAGSACSQSAK